MSAPNYMVIHPNVVDISLKSKNVKLMKLLEESEVIRIHPLSSMDTCTKCKGNLSSGGLTDRQTAQAWVKKDNKNSCSLQVKLRELKRTVTETIGQQKTAKEKKNTEQKHRIFFQYTCKCLLC